MAMRFWNELSVRNGCTHNQGNCYLDGVREQLHRENEREGLVGVPEDRRVPHGKHNEGESVVHELRGHWKPGLLLFQVVADLKRSGLRFDTCLFFYMGPAAAHLRRGVVKWRLSGGAGGVDRAASQELQDDQAVVVRHEPVDVRAPNTICTQNKK